MQELQEILSSIDLHKAYPETEIVSCCHADAMLLQNDYAAKGSETTAVLTYIYQSYILKPYHETISKIIERVAMQEMHHHDLLGTTIVKLGGNPIIGDNSRYWYGGYVNYNKNIHNMLICNIKAEEEAIAGYNFTKEKLRTRQIVPLIDAIIEDEKLHIDIFNALLNIINIES